MNKWGFVNLGHNGNHDLWVKLYNISRAFKTVITAVLTVKSSLNPHRLEFHVQGKWLMMSTFKRTARMRVGGRGYGGPSRIRRRATGRTPGGAAASTPFGATAGATQEKPKDPAIDPEDPDQDPNDGDAPPSDDDEDDDEAGPVVITTHRWFDYPLPVPRMLRETLEMLHYDQPWITYVGTRCRHPVLHDDWDMIVEISIQDEFGSRRDIHVRHAPTRRNSYEAAISDATREA
ncbi:hypothetical protein U9M48_019487 [Paspalum notatum var. saurae]|uniref:Uncharacterized protein n=1 Tax=Paspalum notatum var. saurae TaxID=547442 RepID=A0AAQ3WRK4_PASNO